MSYCANGSGSIKFATVISDAEKVEVKRILSELYVCSIWDMHGPYTIADFYGDGSYNEDAVYDVLERVVKVAPAEHGTVCYDGEDGASWRFVYDGKWVEESAVKLYNDAELLDEVKRKGYKVIKEDNATVALRNFLRYEMKFRLEDIHEVDATNELIDECVEHFIKNSDELFNYEAIDEAIAKIVEKSEKEEAYFGA